MRLARLVIPFFAAAVLVTGCDVARPVSEATTAECARCHGFPPAAPHPQLANAQAPQCNECHATTVAPDGTIIPGGTHMDGHVDGGHPAQFADPAQHGLAANAALSWCQACHGDNFEGAGNAPSCTACHTTNGYADWKTNCTFCHGTRTQSFTAADLAKAAPPQGPGGETLTSQAAVGAHAKHVNGAISAPLTCSTCHTVPASGDLGHTESGTPFALGGLGAGGTYTANSATGGTCSSVYCHGATLNGGSTPTPTWTGTLDCAGCHGTPPKTGAVLDGVTRHEFHVSAGLGCFNCHAQVAAITSSPAIIDTPAAKALHVNGAKDVAFTVDGTWDADAGTCSSVTCHGAGTTMYWRTNP